VVGEERRQAGVEVTGGVGMGGEELLGGAELGVGSRGSENDRRGPALVRSSRRSGEQNDDEWSRGGGGEARRKKTGICPCPYALK
jgi:hypothetical protein